MEKLESLKGIGPKTIQNLNRLNIYSVEDLVSYYPYRFEVLEKSSFQNFLTEEKIVTDGILETEPLVYFFRKKMNKMSFRVDIGTNIINVVIFNRAFLKPNLHIGTKVTLIGKYDSKKNLLTVSDIRLGLLPPKPVIEPVYHVTSGISSNQLHKMILSGLNTPFTVEEILPDYLVGKYHLPEKRASIREIHAPGNKKSLLQALNYLKYEELFLFMLKMNYLKKNRILEKGIYFEIYFPTSFSVDC